MQYENKIDVVVEIDYFLKFLILEILSYFP
jgi:hypothetical protein